MKDTSLHPAYSKVRFRGPWPDHSHPDEFAIITAYATTGETWSEERNRAADLKLEDELRGTGSWMRRLTGYDPETGHAEPGWAVGIGFEEALDLGRRSGRTPFSGSRRTGFGWRSAHLIFNQPAASRSPTGLKSRRHGDEPVFQRQIAYKLPTRQGTETARNPGKACAGNP